MSAYAILGATGSTGHSILKRLGASPDNDIHVLVRSRAKLEQMYPSLPEKRNIKVFEGSISDHDVLAQCLSGTKAAFLTVAVKHNEPGTSIAMDTAHAVVTALEMLRKQERSFKAPKLVVLSSASLDDKFWKDIPTFVHNTMYCAAYYIYEDLRRAEAYLRKQESWLSSTFVMPGGLSEDDVQRGHELSTERQQTFIGFLDLAGAMIEVADEQDGKWDGAHVSVTLKPGQRGKVEWRVPIFVFKGLLCYYFPWLHKCLP